MAALTFATMLKLLEPPAGMETALVQVAVLLSLRVHDQLPALGPATTSGFDQVIGAGSSSRKKIVPTEAASPLLLTVNT